MIPFIGIKKRFSVSIIQYSAFRYQYTDFWYQKPSKMPFSNNGTSATVFR